MTAAPAAGAEDQDSASTVTDRKDSVYCDAGLIIAVVLGPTDPFFDAVMRFFKAVEDSGLRLIISSLALSEAVDVILKRSKASNRCTDESGREREAVEAKAVAAVKDTVRFVYNLKSSKKADILEEEVEVRPDLEHLYKKMLEHLGKTPQARKGYTYRHEGIGPIDWIHIALARLAGVRAICTTDKAMAQISGDAQYGNLEVIVLRRN